MFALLTLVPICVCHTWGYLRLTVRWLLPREDICRAVKGRALKLELLGEYVGSKITNHSYTGNPSGGYF